MLSEKEIAKLIKEYIRARGYLGHDSRGPMHKLENVEAAAHAITEKLAEGVVLDTTAVFDWDGTMPALYLDDEPSPDALVSGEPYAVTVTKKE